MSCAMSKRASVVQSADASVRANVRVLVFGAGGPATLSTGPSCHLHPATPAPLLLHVLRVASPLQRRVRLKGLAGVRRVLAMVPVVRAELVLPGGLRRTGRRAAVWALARVLKQLVNNLLVVVSLPNHVVFPVRTGQLQLPVVEVRGRPSMDARTSQMKWRYLMSVVTPCNPCSVNSLGKSVMMAR